ncbi:MAG TPA: ferredoxin [Roseburia sp.]|nr:ferredoxin [Roseburia sp.]
MICVNINNAEYLFDCDPTERLVDILRKKLNFTGVKEGCGEGECGACSVIIDGRLSNSCLVAIGSVDGSCVTTIEGLRNTKRFEVLDKAFADAGAVQCGFCTPGMIMAAEALLEKNPHPTEADVRLAISGNICRCTGYNMIIDAVLSAAERGAGLW